MGAGAQQQHARGGEHRAGARQQQGRAHGHRAREHEHRAEPREDGEEEVVEALVEGERPGRLDLLGALVAEHLLRLRPAPGERLQAEDDHVQRGGGEGQDRAEGEHRDLRGLME
jgi:hypothetical protein